MELKNFTPLGIRKTTRGTAYVFDCGQLTVSIESLRGLETIGEATVTVGEHHSLEDLGQPCTPHALSFTKEEREELVMLARRHMALQVKKSFASAASSSGLEARWDSERLFVKSRTGAEYEANPSPVLESEAPSLLFESPGRDAFSVSVADPEVAPAKFEALAYFEEHFGLKDKASRR